MRSFLAIELSEEIRARLGELQRELQKAGIQARYVRPEGVHLTLKFLGEVEPSLVPQLEMRLRPLAARCPGLTLEARGLGAFPNLKRPRVLWVGVHAPAELLRLQSEVEAAMAEEGFAPEERAFHPHLTLAREPDPRAAERLERLLQGPERELGRFRAEALILFESQLQKGGARYTPRASFVFSAAAGVAPNGSP